MKKRENLNITWTIFKDLQPNRAGVKPQKIVGMIIKTWTKLLQRLQWNNDIVLDLLSDITIKNIYIHA